jgi:superfamily II RNA helicase
MGVPAAATFVPDQFQLDAIRTLGEQQDTLVIAPTGAGKTYIAIEAIRSVVEKGGRACYTAPLKALSNSKYVDFKRIFEPKYSVGLLTGDRKIEGDAQVVIATTEIFRNELYSFSENYSLVVLDEFHYLADPQRGPVWEESIILAPRSSTLLMLSASISNPEEVCQWMEEVRKKPIKIVSAVKRPVELRWGFLHPELGVLPLTDHNGHLNEEITHYYAGEKEFRPGFRGKRRNRRGFYKK